MVSLNKVSDDEFLKYQDIFKMADGLFGWTREDSFKVEIDSTEYIMFGYHPVFMLFGYGKDSKLEYKSCVVDDEYNVISFTFNNYQINIDGNLVYLIDENGRHQYLQMVRNRNNPDFEVSANGLLTYMQYDSKKDVRLVIRYDQNVYGDSGVVFADYLKEPFFISIENRPILRDKGLFFLGRKDAYYRLDFDIYNNRWQYDLATMQEFGIAAVMAEDTVTLHGGQTEFSRYYRQLFSVGDYFSVTGFPLLKQYKNKEMDMIIEALGFNKTVPEFVARVYNNREEFVSQFQAIMNAYINEESLNKEKK